MVRDIQIHPVLNGFICTVGCQVVVFNDRLEMSVEIGRYYGDPEGVEKEYIKKAVNKTMEQRPIQPEGRPPLTSIAGLQISQTDETRPASPCPPPPTCDPTPSRQP